MDQAIILLAGLALVYIVIKELRDRGAEAKIKKHLDRAEGNFNDLKAKVDEKLK